MKSFKKAILAASMLALSAPAWSIPLGVVGGIDNLLHQTTLPNSGEKTEINWIKSRIGDFDEGLYEQSNVSAPNWTGVDGLLGVFALELTDPYDWFLIKIGKNSGSSSTHFLFENVALLNYAVIDLVAMGFSEKHTLNIGKISHIGAGPTTTTVPEPGSLALLGLGLLGLTLTRRRLQPR